MRGHRQWACRTPVYARVSKSVSKLVLSCCTHSRRSLTGHLLQRPHAVGAGAVGDVTPRHQDHHSELRAVLAGRKLYVLTYVLYPMGTLRVLRPN